MDLQHVKGIGPAKQQKLKEAGVADVETLARCDAAEVARKTGMSEATVREYKERAAALALLQDVKGVGPATVQALAEAGVKSLKEFYEASAEWLAAQMKVAQARAQEMQAEARKLADHVAQESKTPEGRKRLAAEGKEAAQKAAKRAQEATQKAVAAAKEGGEKAVQKAKEMRDKAPEYVEKAQARLKEAEVKVQEAAHKTGEALKKEGEKVKAANESFLERMKARFQRKPPE